MEPTAPSPGLENTGWRAMPRRMLSTALLDPEAYEEVEADRTATSQAFLVVLLASAAAGLGGIDNHGALGIVWHSVHGIVLWGIWAWVTCLIGTRLLPTTATESDWGELLRTIGFSSSPGLIRIFCVYEPIALSVFLVAVVWTFVAMVVAVRQALDYTSTWRAIAVCAIGFPIYLVGLLVSLLLLGPWPI